MYDAKRFTDDGLVHHELYFPDGSCPTDHLLLRFLELAEQVLPRIMINACGVQLKCEPLV